MSARALVVRVAGTVQGVGYRAFTRQAATRRGITGWVVNRPDGSVEAALQGPGEALAELIAELRRGPPAAQVETLDVRSADAATASSPPPEAYRF